MKKLFVLFISLLIMVNGAVFAQETDDEKDGSQDVVTGSVSVSVYAPEEPISAPMNIACDLLSEDALEYVQSQGLCIQDDSLIQPMDWRPGDCGATWLWLRTSNSSLVGFDIGAESFHGPITVLNYNVSWTNWDTNSVGGFGHPSVTVNNQIWEDFETQTTGRGYITSSMSGGAWVWFGPITIYCAFFIPSDAVTN